MNDPYGRPTFSSANGESWVDVTVCLNVREWEWCVLEDETMSDHQYIEVSIKGMAINNEKDEVGVMVGEITYNEQAIKR